MAASRIVSTQVETIGESVLRRAPRRLSVLIILLHALTAQTVNRVNIVMNPANLVRKVGNPTVSNLFD